MKNHTQEFSDAAAAVDHAKELLSQEQRRITGAFARLIEGYTPADKVQGFYPEMRIHIAHKSSPKNKTRPTGYCRDPGTYASTLSALDVLGGYYTEQLGAVMVEHEVNVSIGLSKTPIPLLYAQNYHPRPEAELPESSRGLVERYFDSPHQAHYISEASGTHADGMTYPLAQYSGAYIDRAYSRLQHYTGTHPGYFQPYVLFTNYHDYIDLFQDTAKNLIRENPQDGQEPYIAFIEPGNIVHLNTNIPNVRTEFEKVRGVALKRIPQMPAYHLVRRDGLGVSIVNVGVGPSNVKTITDELAILRSRIWMMIGHCAGLDPAQDIGDYVIPNGFILEDGLMERVFKGNIDIPELSEVHMAITGAIRTELKLEGDAYKSSARTGIVTTTADRNWEVPGSSAELQALENRFRANRSIALDMESGTLAANGFRHRVPYGALLCVSDKPMHGMPKLNGLANDFYRSRVRQQFGIAMRAIDNLRGMGESVHSRKLRSGFDYSPFL